MGFDLGPCHLLYFYPRRDVGKYETHQKRVSIQAFPSVSFEFFSLQK